MIPFAVLALLAILAVIFLGAAVAVLASVSRTPTPLAPAPAPPQRVTARRTWYHQAPDGSLDAEVLELGYVGPDATGWTAQVPQLRAPGQ